MVTQAPGLKLQQGDDFQSCAWYRLPGRAGTYLTQAIIYVRVMSDYEEPLKYLSTSPSYSRVTKISVLLIFTFNG